MSDYIADIMTKKINGKYLVSTISGAWDVLTQNEYNLVLTGKAKKDKKFYDRLVEEGIVITKDNLEMIKTRIRQRYSFLCYPITLHIIAITDRCTHNCVYCHAKPDTGFKKGVRDMDKKTASKVMDFIVSNPSKTLTVEFQGGEPLLNFKTIKYIITNLEKRKGKKTIDYRLTTNLSKMTNVIFNELMKFGVRFTTSLDGPKKLHNKNRPMGYSSSYDNVIKWLSYAKERFNQPIGLLPTITRYSLQYGVKGIIDEYIKNKTYHIRLRELNFGGLAVPGWEKIGYKADEFYEFWKQGVDYCIKLYESGIPMREELVGIILQRLLSPYGGGYMCFRSPCGAGINQIAYSPDGNIYFCDASRGSGEEFVIGNIRNTTYKDIVSKTRGLRGLSNIINSCRNCVWSPYCGTCLLGPSGRGQSFIPITQRDFHCQLRQKQLEYVIKLLMGKHKQTLLEWWQANENIGNRSKNLEYQARV